MGLLDPADFIHPNDLPRSLSCRRAFAEAARFQKVCAKCGKGGVFHAHHVVEEQILKRMGLPRWDYRCALRGCFECHFGHHGGGDSSHRITTQQLDDLNIVFIVCVFGPAARQFIVRNYWHYAEEAEDPRLAEALDLRPADMPVNTSWDLTRA